LSQRYGERASRAIPLDDFGAAKLVKEFLAGLHEIARRQGERLFRQPEKVDSFYAAPNKNAADQRFC
jgi:hypothetical protein